MVCGRARRTARHVRGVPRSQARATTSSTTTTCCSGGRRCPHPAAAPHAAIAVRPRARRRVPGHQRAAIRSPVRAGVGGRRSLPSATTRRRSTASAPRRMRNILEFPTRVRRRARRRARAQPPVDAADPARHQRGHRSDGRAPRQALWSTRPDGPPAVARVVDDEGAQVDVVPRDLAHCEARRSRCTNRRCCSAPPTTAICSSSSSAARRIPYVKYGGLRFLEAAHVKDLLCVLRIVENPNDELAWFRVLQLLDGIGPATGRVLAVTGATSPKTTCPKPALRCCSRSTTRGTSTGGRARVPPVEASAGVARRPGRRALSRDRRARLADLDELTKAASHAPSLERFLTDLVARPAVGHR